MVSENGKKWLAALRSGNYVQGKGTLCKDGAYCCLGVACNLYQKDVGNLSVSPSSVDGRLRFDQESATLPTKVRLWLRVDHNPRVMWKDSAITVAQLNDAGVSFMEIAQLLEDQASTVFTKD